MSVDAIRDAVASVAVDYYIKRVDLFGSRASGAHSENSDVDLLVEFSSSVSLLTISRLRVALEELMGIDVDIVHGPLRESDLLEIGEVIEIYAA